MKPIIGITPSFDESKQTLSLSRDYYNAIVKAGGVPFVFAYTGKTKILGQLALCDGILMTGGGDIDPTLFGQEPIPKLGDISPTRDRCEISLARQALANQIPVLGVCRGMQLLGVAGGGTMFQDMDSQAGGTLQHWQKAPMWHCSHEIQIKSGSLLRKILGVPQIKVNSYHHQAVDILGDGCIACGHASDGIIEAIEYPAHPFALGVQWHPETITDNPAHPAIFNAMVEAALERRSKK